MNLKLKVFISEFSNGTLVPLGRWNYQITVCDREVDGVFVMWLFLKGFFVIPPNEVIQSESSKCSPFNVVQRFKKSTPEQNTNVSVQIQYNTSSWKELIWIEHYKAYEVL